MAEYVPCTGGGGEGKVGKKFQHDLKILYTLQNLF